MSLSDVELAQVAAELTTDLVGATVARVRQRDELTFRLETRRHDLVLCARPRVARVHLDTHDKPTEPPPTPFALSLRKELRGARLLAAAATAGDRVLTLDFDAVSLVVELSTQPNLILVERSGITRAALHPSAGERRTVLAGQPFTPLTPDPAAAAPPWRGRDRFGPPPGTSQRIAHAYAALELELSETTLRRAVTGALERARARAGRLIRGLEQDRARADAAQVYRKYGDLLLAHLGEVPRGVDAITLSDDFEDGAALSIALDPARSPRENATRYYQQHKKLSGSLVTIDARLGAARARLAELDALAARAAAADLAALTALSGEVDRALPAAQPRTAREKRSAETRAALPYHEFTSAAGDTIWVGKGARANDELTFRHARGNDLWLHTREVPGAHVVVRLGAGRTLVEPTLLDAATLAAHYSQARNASDVDVAYTYRKHVRRAGRDAPPGLVTLANAKTFRIRLDSDRLQRLLSGLKPSSKS